MTTRDSTTPTAPPNPAQGGERGGERLRQAVAALAADWEKRGYTAERWGRKAEADAYLNCAFLLNDAINVHGGRR